MNKHFFCVLISISSISCIEGQLLHEEMQGHLSKIRQVHDSCFEKFRSCKDAEDQVECMAPLVQGDKELLYDLADDVSAIVVHYNESVMPLCQAQDPSCSELLEGVVGDLEDLLDEYSTFAWKCDG